jgi:hypothetical protein
VSIVNPSTQAIVQQWSASATIAQGKTYPLTENWNVPALVPGNYLVVLNATVNGKTLALAQDSFTVLSTATTGVGLAGTIAAAPKQANVGDAMSFTGAVNNQGNVDLNGLPVSLTVRNAGTQAVVQSWTSTPTIAKGASSSVAQSWTVSGAVAPGNYLVVLAATVNGATKTLAQDTFTVLSTAVTGAGLTGTIAASPKQAYAGDTVSFLGSAANQGNADLNSLPLTVTVTNSDTQALMQTWSYTAGIVQGKSFTLTQNWANVPKGNYAVVLQASVGGKTLTLAQDTFAVIDPPVKLGITQSVLRDARVLVLIACDNSQNQGYVPPCVPERASFVDAYLNTLGIEHKIVTDLTSFALAFRSGRYNTYWLSGSADKLDSDLAGEVVEAVNRGDGFVMDGVHDQRNHLLDPLLGVDYRGKLPAASTPTVVLTGSAFATGSFAATGDALKVVLTNGYTQAAFNSSSGDPAIVTTKYGQGQSVLYAFDLVAVLEAQANSPLLQNVVASGIGYVLPAVPSAWSGGAYVPILTTIRNQAQDVDVEVIMTVPAGITIVGATPTAITQTATQTTWRFTLLATKSQTLELDVRAASASGHYTIQTQVNSIYNGVSKPYQTLTFDVTVIAGDQIAPQTTSALQALNLASTQEKKARDNAVADLQQAASDLSQGKPLNAIEDYLAAIGQLAGITSVSTASIEFAIDGLLEEAERQWCLANGGQ